MKDSKQLKDWKLPEMKEYTVDVVQAGTRTEGSEVIGAFTSYKVTS